MYVRYNYTNYQEKNTYSHLGPVQMWCPGTGTLSAGWVACGDIWCIVGYIGLGNKNGDWSSYWDCTVSLSLFNSK
jgi:hypothetical protein